MNKTSFTFILIFSLVHINGFFISAQNKADFTTFSDSGYLQQHGLNIPEPYSQDSFDRLNWKVLTKDIDYGLKENEPDIQAKPSNPLNAKLKAWFFKIAVISILLVTVVLIYINLRKNKNRLPIKNLKLNSSEITGDWDIRREDIQLSNVSALYRQAYISKDYILAIRYFYIKILGQLHEKKLIQFEKSKTDTNYIDELTGTELRDQFVQLTKFFSRYWYGKQTIGESEFQIIINHFSTFSTRIKDFPNEEPSN